MSNEKKDASASAGRGGGIFISAADHRVLSARRELNQRQVEALIRRYRDPKENLGSYTRDELEGEIRLLRKELNEVEERILENDIQLRDILSQEATGKDDAYLHLNQTPDRKQTKPVRELLLDAGRRALGGGLPGAVAMASQVTLLMWIRTIMNFQYRHGMGSWAAATKLYQEGGLPRFYRGYLPALIQGPLSRFGDTAANSGVLALLDSFESTKHLPVAIKTLFASGAAASWRILLMPVDTVKTMMQVEGQDGFKILVAKMRQGGPTVLFHGAIGASVATFVGHYPWFFTFNYLNQHLPRPAKDDMWGKLGRNAFIGFVSSAISDTMSNSLRVIKTTKQTYEKSISYRQAVMSVVDKDGVRGLFGRGLKTRILANGLQGMLFTVIWKGLEDTWNARKEAQKTDSKNAA